INNAAGVTLSQATVINGVLRLVSGVFDNTIPFTLGPSGSISNEGGSLKNPATSIDGPGDVVPQSFFVDQNFPNPFNPSTTISYGLPSEENVVVKVYSMLGQEVATLFEGRQAAGTYQMQFNASHLPSGAYIYRVQAGSSTVVKQMMLLK
ncbi:MAG: T9SS type A sorting domain-containing protein, partial [Bacteroidota bacterium]